MITSAKVISVGLLSVGVFILMQVILPITSFQIWANVQKLNNQILVSPVTGNQQVLGVSVKNTGNFSAIISNLSRTTKPNYDWFQISIPRLKMEDSTVFVDNNDLTKGLSQLPGSALPGEKGNLFISGHSALYRFIPGQPAPFANLPDMKKGDEVVINASGTEFVYKVAEIKVVDPSDMSVVLPLDKQGRYISLMTCVPPGLNYKRLIVIGKMM